MWPLHSMGFAKMQAGLRYLGVHLAIPMRGTYRQCAAAPLAGRRASKTAKRQSCTNETWVAQAVEQSAAHADMQYLFAGLPPRLAQGR